MTNPTRCVVTSEGEAVITMTDDEAAAFREMQEAIEAKRALRLQAKQEAAAARASGLAKLGLTPEEISAVK